uniref:Putative secreted protein n=1 Tax=Amblyomma triste TaxID=251400 RepID=A0A023G218_AMBTT
MKGVICLMFAVVLSTASQSNLETLFGNLVPENEGLDMPHRYFAVYDPRNLNGTQFRFNLTNGKLHMRSTEKYNTESVGKCGPQGGGFMSCHIPIDGSFATYDSFLYYGKETIQTFSTKVTVESYFKQWYNPADISAYMKQGSSGLNLTKVTVTDFKLETTASPPFKEFNFSVFLNDTPISQYLTPAYRLNWKNITIVDYVWHNFTERMYRTVKQDMKKVMEQQFSERIGNRSTSVSTAHGRKRRSIKTRE